MTVDHAPKTIKDIQAEYDHLFATDPIRDEDRAYKYFAEKLLLFRDCVYMGSFTLNG